MRPHRRGAAPITRLLARPGIPEIWKKRPAPRRTIPADGIESDGVFGLSLIVGGMQEVLRFELMIERGLREAATSIRKGSAA
jgi:hypothetical protein